MEINVGGFDFDTITIKDLNGESVTYDLKEELKFNEFNAVQEFATQPAKYVYWASVLEKVKMYRDASELKAETYKSSIYDLSRTTLVNNGINKPTKEQVSAQIMQDPQYVQLLESINTYSHLVGQLTYVVKAFEQRKDMLVQFGAELRRSKEYDRQLSMPQHNQ